MVRGEPDELRGESGGVLAAGNKEGNGLIERAFVFVEFSSALKGTPAFASASNDLTRRQVSGSESHCEKSSSATTGLDFNAKGDTS
uniref:Uncharacterized protein n=1 Tax=Medicago truncatula TaxID=3880 RepID=I3SCA4_MEDTR|nr:unknown [Medicago truncatula]